MLAFFHTAQANAVTFESIAQELAPGLATRHIVRADLLERATAAQCVTPDLQADTIAAIATGKRILVPPACPARSTLLANCSGAKVRVSNWKCC